MDEQFVLCELENGFFCMSFKVNRTYKFITAVLFISTSQVQTALQLSNVGSTFKIPLRSIWRRLRFSAIRRSVNW